MSCGLGNSGRKGSVMRRPIVRFKYDLHFIVEIELLAIAKISEMFVRLFFMSADWLKCFVVKFIVFDV